MGTRNLGRTCAIAGCVLALVACGDDDAMTTADSGMVDGGGSDGATDAGPDAGTDTGTDTGPDPCMGIVQCSPAGLSCDGDELVTCAADRNGCLVENTETCTGGCEADPSPTCVDDPCVGVAEADRCDPADEGFVCDGNDLIQCAANTEGCFVTTTTDCTMEDGTNTCGDPGDGPVCLNDPCFGRTDLCDTEGTTCDGDDVVTCAFDAIGCLSETTDDCAARGATCDDTGATPMCSGADCDDTPNPCDAEGTMCSGPNLVRCATDVFGCLAETTSDCTETMFGFCDPDGDPAACDVAESDPCEGVTECDPVGRTCDADTLHVCARDARGCMVNTATDCTADSGACDDSGAMAVCTGDLCPAATTTDVVLDCESGTVTFDTADGTRAIQNNDCVTFQYAGSEAFFRFQSAIDAEVDIVSTVGMGPGGATPGDMDLFVLDGSDACDRDATCVDSSTGTTATETVNFVAGAGDPYYVLYDLFDGTPGSETTSFTLDITCTPVVCGDSVVAGGETCDDGDTDAGDGCDDACQIEMDYVCTGEPSMCEIACGNGETNRTLGETCDDGDTDPGDGCDADCRVEARYVCTGEPSMCEIACGNGETNTLLGETCDDGDLDDGDGCDSTCRVEDGFVCSGEPSVCGPPCGNGALDPGEACDDGDTDTGDGCDDACMPEAGFDCRGEPSVCTTMVCGDATVGWSESCDDMNDVTGDGCHMCALEIDNEIVVDLDRSITLSGSLDATDPSWARPGASCAAGTPPKFYDEHRIINTTGVAQTVTITAAWAGGDGYLHVYRPGFDPTTPLLGCDIGDDDFGGTSASQLVAIPLASGESISIMASTFRTADAIGAYTITVDVDVL